jgi:ATPases involved in chromosome partitioning
VRGNRLLNFIKGSIFSRNTRSVSEKNEPEMASQVLAVWGSPGSGKTAVAVKLAKYLADKRKNVALLLCDMTAPMLPCICSPTDLECEKSLGSILAAAHITDTLIKQNCITHRKMNYLTLIGMLKGENVFTYPPYNAELAKELIECLRDIVPYVIIDCGSTIATDILSAVSLMEADSVLRLVNCDLKSVSYLSSQLPLLQDNSWNTEKQYKAASNIKSGEAGESIERVMGNTVFKIPHSDELENQFLEGDLFQELVLKDSRGFRNEITKIAKEVFSV